MQETPGVLSRHNVEQGLDKKAYKIDLDETWGAEKHSATLLHFPPWPRQ